MIHFKYLAPGLPHKKWIGISLWFESLLLPCWCLSISLSELWTPANSTSSSARVPSPTPLLTFSHLKASGGAFCQQALGPAQVIWGREVGHGFRSTAACANLGSVNKWFINLRPDPLICKTRTEMVPTSGLGGDWVDICKMPVVPGTYTRCPVNVSYCGRTWI